jgi:diguanylate cyclase (GGDEF)-like protein
MLSVLKYLGRQSKPLLFFVFLLFVGLLGYLDFVTGDLSLLVFYLAPIGLGTWFISRKTGFLLSLASTLAWFISEGVERSFVHNWNLIIAIMVFIGFTYMLSLIRQELNHEKILARRDPLTKVANVRAFNEYANNEITRMNRYSHPLTIVSIDLDNFKPVNDTLGHSVGDILLATVASTIRNNIRATDFVARLGGDEFSIILPETDTTQGQIVLNKLKEILMETMRQNKWPVTFSIGVVTCITPPCSVDDMLKMADKALYTVKNNGKNNIKYDYFSISPATTQTCLPKP